jgi:WXG100 family type VII secretion target
MSMIKVDPHVLQEAHSQMKSIAQGMDQKLDTLRSGLQRMEWEGSDRQAYQEHQQKWDKAVTDLNQVLNQIGGAVGIASDNYVSTEMSNSKLWG